MEEVIYSAGTKDKIKVISNGRKLYLDMPAAESEPGTPFEFSEYFEDTPENRQRLIAEANRLIAKS